MKHARVTLAPIETGIRSLQHDSLCNSVRCFIRRALTLVTLVTSYTIFVSGCAVFISGCAGDTASHTPSRSVPEAQPSLPTPGSRPRALEEVPATTPATANTDPAKTMRVRHAAVMGTELFLKASGANPEQVDAALDAALLEIQRVEDLMTDWRPSPLTTLNEAAGQGAQPVPAELLQIIERGLEVGRVTGGAFDITYAAAGRLWDFKAKPPILPNAEAITRALAGVGYQKIRVDAEQGLITLPAGSRIGLGGIAKGYGIDQAMKTLRAHGIKNGLVNAGGDMKVLGLDGGQPWEIAVKHPRDSERAIAVLRLSNTCVVTSGDYERFFVHEGKRYHHIIDPRDGYPSRGCLSATVVAQNAELADTLATALCVLGPEVGLQLIEKIQRCEAIVVGLDESVRASSGLEGALR